jgi:2-amino-4-hydroxy-6-hydroxymethyldihydropteridine diphosphokinase
MKAGKAGKAGGAGDSERSPDAAPRAGRVLAAVALGSNLGERAATLQRALTHLETTPGVVLLRRSRWLRNPAVGGPPGQGEFLNGVALLETTLSPHALLDCLLRIEVKLGRDRSVAVLNGPRSIDLDLLFHGEARIDDALLSLPHPRLEERRFVLEPLAELLPELRLAGCGKTVRERLAELPPLESAAFVAEDA